MTWDRSSPRRLRLVPVHDTVIRDLLGPVDHYWSVYRYALDDGA